MYLLLLSISITVLILFDKAYLKASSSDFSKDANEPSYTFSNNNSLLFEYNKVISLSYVSFVLLIRSFTLIAKPHASFGVSVSWIKMSYLPPSSIGVPIPLV